MGNLSMSVGRRRDVNKIEIGSFLIQQLLPVIVDASRRVNSASSLSTSGANVGNSHDLEVAGVPGNRRITGRMSCFRDKAESYVGASKPSYHKTTISPKSLERTSFVALASQVVTAQAADSSRRAPYMF